MPTESAAAKPPIMMFSPGFADWLARIGGSLALTTYQAGRLIFIGLKPDGSIRSHERLIEHCQGLWTDGGRLWVSGKSVLWRFENDLQPGRATAQGASRRFLPREGRVTGALDIHDIGMGNDNRPIFVNTAFSCLATISETASFKPLWRPRFISQLLPEDRCHLNGLAMDGTRPAYVTAIARSDVADGWRDKRGDGGIVIDVATGEIVASGFSMPHSPRLHGGKLWLLNSGTGEFGTLDVARGRFEPVAFCPGYARGLAFIGGHAVIGLSRPRRNHTFSGLALDERLAAKGAEPRAGLIAVDLTSGAVAAWLRFTHTIEELYDVAALPCVVQAEAIGFKGDEIERMAIAEGIPAAGPLKAAEAMATVLP
jgi:uncharacterized protein (TIGR03032 family)